MMSKDFKKLQARICVQSVLPSFQVLQQIPLICKWLRSFIVVQIGISLFFIDDNYFHTWNFAFVAMVYMHHTHLLRAIFMFPKMNVNIVIFQESSTFMYAGHEYHFKSNKAKLKKVWQHARNICSELSYCASVR
jgi:hypothetical protein